MQMLGVPNQRVLRSISKYAIADITIDFNDGTDLYWRAQVYRTPEQRHVRHACRCFRRTRTNPPPLGEMFMFTVEGEGISLEDRRSAVDWIIRPALRTLPGVADVKLIGRTGAQL